MSELKPSRRRIPKPLDKRTGQFRLPNPQVTREFLQALQDYCAEHDLVLSDFIRETLAEKIGFGQKQAE